MLTQKLDATVHTSVVLCTTVEGWEAETGELLEAHRPVSLAHTAAKERQHLRAEDEKTNIQNRPLTSPCVQWSMALCTHT